MAGKIKEAKLKTLNMFNDISTDDPDYPLWEKISAYMDGEIVYVIESSLKDGTYVFLGLKDKEKDREVHYMTEQDSRFGVYIDDRKKFNEDWDSGKYEPDGCHYLNPENVEFLDKECPKSEIEKVQWLKWENLKEWGEIECPMLGNERVMTYHLEGFPTYYSYTAPFVDEDGDVCYYKYDHDEDCWEDSIMCMGEYEEGTHYRMC